jgi:PAS domain S-box-containing protein
MIERLCYVFGVVGSSVETATAPAGIDGGAVTLISNGDVSALATSVSAEDYAPDKVEALTADVDWVSQRAMAHDRVLTWASDQGAVIPFPMWTLFRDAKAVKAMLSKRMSELQQTFKRLADGREFIVRVYVQPGVLKHHLAEHNAELTVLEAEAAKASPGQKYLLERKMENLRRDAGRDVASRVANEIHDALRAPAMETVREQPVNLGARREQGRAILNASFLVAPPRVVEFQRALTEMVNKYEPSGFKFDFTGPWPPYHFATLGAVMHAASLASPVLSRMAAVEEFRLSTSRLDQQREMLTGIVNSLPDPIVIVNASHDIVVQNERAEHLLSTGDKDSDGRRRAVEINNLLFTSHVSKAAMGANESAGSRELNLVDPAEGTDLLFEVLTHDLSGVEGSQAGSTVSVLRDVTDLRRAANELERQVQRVRLAEIDAKRERDRLNLILENVADPILVTDDRSNIILMNKEAEQLFETDDSDGGERPATVQANDTKFTTFISDFTISPSLARREQMTLHIPDTGVELPVEVVSGKILNRRGEPLAIVSVLHDLTGQVENERLYDELKTSSSQLEDRIHAATADLAEQNTRLQWQSRELEKANRLKSEFLASMSHELRTPINALIGYASLMLDRIYGELNPRQEEGLSRIQGAAQHLLALINDILDLAKIEAGRMPLHLDDVTLGNIVTEISQQIEPLLKKKTLTFNVEMPSNDLTLHTDRTKVKQILLNLLSNAVKFTHHGGIWVTISKDEEDLRFDVRDTGIGIRASDLESIWEDFRQVDQSRTREFGGTGLGLSITRKLVDALGGHIFAESVYGQGSTFTVVLPVRSVAQPDDLPRMVDEVPPPPRAER